MLKKGFITPFLLLCGLLFAVPCLAEGGVQGKLNALSSYLLDDDNLFSENWLFDIQIYAWALLFIIGGFVSSIFAKSRNQLKYLVGGFRFNATSEREAEILYATNQKSLDWGIWSNHGVIRYLLIDAGFVISPTICSMAPEDSRFAVLGLLIYFTLIDLIQGGMLWWEIHKENEGPVDLYQRIDAVFQRKYLMVHFLLAPHIALPLYYLLKQEKERAAKEILLCPICQSTIERTPSIAYEPKTACHTYELEHQITQGEMYECRKGHTIRLILPAKNFCGYKQCPSCGGHTLKEVKSHLSKAATPTNEGTYTSEYKCDHCEATHKIIHRIPKEGKSTLESDSEENKSGLTTKKEERITRRRQP